MGDAAVDNGRILREDAGLLLLRSGDGETSLLVRVASDPPSHGAQARLEHEFELRNRLDAAWAAVPIGLDTRSGAPTLRLTDPGGECLSGLLGEPWPVQRLLLAAVGLARALGQLHGRALIHRDLRPANLLVDPDSGRVWLTGFGMAADAKLPNPPHAGPLHLAYLAPEQTGRMNRAVDARSDLYACGVCLYEMITGTLPFLPTSAMETVHAHLAREPLPPHERMPGVPRVLSDLVMKLLAKSPEERYQSAEGLESDLRRAQQELVADPTETLASFVLGRDEVPRLCVPARLFGRQVELDRLLATLQRTRTSGQAAFVLVGGYSGVGKSAFVRALRDAPGAADAWFVSGKFDQFKRDIPYAGIAEAMQDLVLRLLGQAPAQLAVWRDSLLVALGAHGQLLITLVPELQLVIGAQPAVTELPPRDAHERLARVFRAFLGVFARAQQPLILFLDDLQWLDEASLELIATLVEGPSPGHLMLVGAFRDNEVGPEHPLSRTLRRFRRPGGPLQEIRLEPLQIDHLAGLIAATLQCELCRVLPLAHLVQERTGGNPFFAIQFLTLIGDEGLLRFDQAQAAWAWDPRQIAAKSSSDNVVSLMVERLLRLPAATQLLLQTMAALGSQVTIRTLAAVCSETDRALHDTLWSAVQSGLVVPVDSGYAFLHDRIQEAAYASITESRRAALHLNIARRLLEGMPRPQLEEHIFEIVRQFDRAAPELRDANERLRVADLNRIAGNRARQTGAHTTAQACYLAGLEALPIESRADHYELAFELDFRLAQCEFLTGQAASAEERLEPLSRVAIGAVDRAAVTCLRVDLYTSLRRSDRAVEVSLDYLRSVGVEWPAHPTREQADQEFKQLTEQIAGRRIEDLIDLPLMQDPAAQATLDVLTSMQPPALFTDAQLHDLVVARMANLSLTQGNSDGSCYGYAVLGVVLGANYDDYDRGFLFGQLGHDLVEHRGLTRFRARAYMSFGAHVNTWSRPLHTSLELVRRAHAFAQESGDLSFSAYSWETIITLLLASGTPLVDVQREAEAGLAFAQRMGAGLVADIITGQLGLIRNLRGLTPTFGHFDDDRFREDDFEARLEDSMLAFAACWYWIRKLQVRYHADDLAGALDALDRGGRLTWTSPGHFELAEFHFYAALARVRQHDALAPSERAACSGDVRPHLRQLETWSRHCPQTFEARIALVRAELARIEGRDYDAMREYERAINVAAANHLVHNEALACELAARHQLACGFDTAGRAYLRRALQAYRRWGAEGKARQIESQYPSLRAASSLPGASLDPGGEQLDLATVLKLCEAISGEIDAGRLIDALMKTGLENAGAVSGLLILPHGEELRLAAEAVTRRDGVHVLRAAEPLGPDRVPISLVHYSVRTLDAVALADAALDNPFASDPYFSARRSRSVLCLPLIKQTSLIGVLYLENPLASHVFNAGRLSVLKLIASQAAIALENALLFEAKLRTESALRVTEARYLLADAAGYGHTDWIVASDEFYGSPRLLEICGLPADTCFSGREDFFARMPLHEEDREGVIRELNEHLRSGLPRIERELRLRVRNHTRWVHLSGVYLRDASGMLLRVTGSYTDVTDRKRAELAQKASEERFAMAIAGTSQGVFDWDLQTDQLFLSQRAQSVLNLEVGEPWRSRPDWFSRFHMHPDDYPAYLRSLKAHLANQAPAYDVEYRLLQADGSHRWYRHRGVALRDSAGKPYRMAGSIEDISDRKFAEEELRRLEKQRRQSQRLEAIGTLAGGIAHDFNNILGAVLGYGEMALRDAPHGSRLRRDLDSIMVAGERGRALVDRILAFSRSGIGERAAVNVAAVVGEALNLLEARLPSNVKIERRIHSGRAALLGDATEVHQVMMNLGTNAIQAMPNGGKLSVSLELQWRDPPRLPDAATLPPGDYLKLTVADTGIGISPDVIERIFDPFFTTREAASGTGLGLSLVHSIVSEVGGAVEVSSTPGQGSEFTVWLPRAGDARRSTAKDSRSLALGNGERILIVDDEEPLLRLACESLTELGYETLGFTSGAAALDVFRSAPERFDALITDERMPGMSGTALIRRVRALRETIPAMLVSGFAGRHVARRALEAGADEVLNKPLSRRELSAAVQRVLESR